MKYWAVFIMFVLTFQSGWTQSTFNKRINLGYPAQLFTSVEVDSSGIYCLGVVGDSLYPYQDGSILVKYNHSGNEEWLKLITSVDKPVSTFYPNLHFQGSDTLVSSGYYKENGVYRGVVIRQDLEGNIIDTMSIHPLAGYPTNLLQAHDVIEFGKNKQLLIFGFQDKSKGRIAASKIDQDTTISEVLLYTGLTHNIYSRVVGKGDTYFIGCQEHGYIFGEFIQRLAILTIDTSLNWSVSWQSDMDSIWSGANAMLMGPDNSLVVAYSRGKYVLKYLDYSYVPSVVCIDTKDWVVKWISDIPTLGYKRFNASENLLSKDSSSFYICGQDWSVQKDSLGWDYMGFIANMTYTGELLWKRRYSILNSNSDDHYLADMKRTPDGGIILVGQTVDYDQEAEPPNQQAWLLKVDSFGCLVPGCQNTTKIDEYPPLSLDIRLYPNPVSDRQVSLYVGEENPIGEMNITLVDLQGSVVKTWKIDYQGPTTYMFEIPSVLPGMYQLVVQAGDRVWAEKLVVQ